MPRTLNVLLTVFAIVLPSVAHGQIGFSPWNPCGCPPRPAPCGTPLHCAAPQPCAAPLGCALPAPVACPQVQTTYRQEQVTTYRPVTRTHIRREAVTVDVPVTTHRQVTVDEGGYQMVWVPKVVTKTVAQTHLQKQVRYRDIPYQTVQHVPQVHTRMVPQQTVRYVAPPMMAVAPSCCQPTPSASVPMVPPATQAVVPQAVVPQAVVPEAELSARESTPVESPASATPPTPQTAATPPSPLPPNRASTQSEWVKVPQRVAQEPGEIELQSYQRSFPETHPAKGMFSRPAFGNTALRTGHLSR